MCENSEEMCENDTKASRMCENERRAATILIVIFYNIFVLNNKRN